MPRPSIPPHDCPLCPRLASFRYAWAIREPDWYNGPVPTFGDDDAELLVVGLAPGVRGANRTGRPFTGDYAGDLLYATLLEFGLAVGEYRASPDDGVRLVRTAITNAVRCVPPENKPTPEEIGTCRQFLSETLKSYPNLRAVFALGRIAHDSVIRTLGYPASRYPFAHGARHSIGELAIFDSYHCSRYNTNTGVLTPDMFRAVVASIVDFLGPLPETSRS